MPPPDRIIFSSLAARLRPVLLASAVLAGAGCGEGAMPDTTPLAAGDARAAAPAPAAQETPPLEADLVPMYRLIESRQTGPARVRLRKHLTLHPDDGQAEFLFGLTYHREKNYASALPWFDKAAAHAPAYDPIHYFRGWALYYLGDTAAAKEAFERHLAYRPDAADSHFGLGLIALDDDDLDEAEARFDRALALLDDTPGSAKERSKAHTRRADVLIRRGAFEEAKQELLVATDLFPDHYEAHYKLYRVLLRLGETERAEESRARFEEARARLHPGTEFPE